MRTFVVVSKEPKGMRRILASAVSVAPASDVDAVAHCVMELRSIHHRLTGKGFPFLKIDSRVEISIVDKVITDSTEIFIGELKKPETGPRVLDVVPSWDVVNTKPNLITDAYFVVHRMQEEERKKSELESGPSAE